MNTTIRPRPVGRAPSGKNGKPMLWKYTGIDSEQWYEDDGKNSGYDFKKPEQKHAERKRLSKSKQGNSLLEERDNKKLSLSELAKKYPSDLTDLLLSKRKRDEDAKAIKAAVHEEMSVRMDTGVRVNQQLKKALLGKS